jgi:hypothetical protein
MRRSWLFVPVALVLLAGCTASDSPAGSVVTVEGSSRPLVTWPDLDAERYVVGIMTESGGWLWEGTDTSVIVGGVAEVDAASPGFGIDGQAQLWFAAFDADGDLVHSERMALG